MQKPGEFDFTPKNLSLKKHIHTGAGQTEKEALEKADYEAEVQRAFVLQKITEAMPDGTIAEAICLIMYGDDQRNIMSIRRRCYDLRDLGKIRRHPEGKSLKNAKGNKCLTWVLGLDPNAGRTKLQEARQRIQELELEVGELKQEIVALEKRIYDLQ